MQKEARLRKETSKAVDCLVHAVEYGIHVTSQVRDCLESIVSFVEFMIQSKSPYTITQDTIVINNIRNKSLNDHISSTKNHCKISLQSAQDTSSKNYHFNKHFNNEKENDDYSTCCCSELPVKVHPYNVGSGYLGGDVLKPGKPM